MVATRKAPRNRIRRRACWIAIGLLLSLWVFSLGWSHFLVDITYTESAIDDGAVSDKAALEQMKALLRQEQPEEVVVVERRAEEAKPAQQIIAANSWHGWQPQIALTMDCPWETCLNPDSGCKTCREEELGPAPPTDPDWIPDATMLHRMFLEGKDAQGQPWPPPIGGDICGDFWGARKDINKQLFQAVPVSIAPLMDSPRIFCGVYTMENAHSRTIRAMRETWAPRCDGFVAFSTASDPRIPAFAIQHEGQEEYNNMWQKSRSIWKFIGDHYLEDYDYFFLGGEDLFVLVDNLRAYLGSLSPGPEADHFVGRRFKGKGYSNDNYFNSGGAGYVLSRATLRKYVTIGYEHRDCSAHEHTSQEDVMMARCLRVAFGIGLTDTRDSQGRERFHPFAPGIHLMWEHPRNGKHDWYEDYNKEWGIGLGAKCCAPDSVSFHYIKKAAMVRHLHGLLYECNGGPTSTQ
jgi:glycoprotein-N-acetylgalactosamine 3-beta-galactosyltransferase